MTWIHGRPRRHAFRIQQPPLGENRASSPTSASEWLHAAHPTAPRNPATAIRYKQKEVSGSTSAAQMRSHSSITGLFSSLRVPHPPGTTRIFRLGQFSKGQSRYVSFPSIFTLSLSPTRWNELVAGAIEQPAFHKPYHATSIGARERGLKSAVIRNKNEVMQETYEGLAL